MRLLFGLKRLLGVEQTELQTDAMQALVPWTRQKEHVMQLSACGLWNAVMLAAKGPGGEHAASLSALKAQHGTLRPGSSMHGVLQTMAINLIRCAAEAAALPWPPSLTLVVDNAKSPDATSTAPTSPTRMESGDMPRFAYAEEEALRRSKEVQASCGSLCLEGEAIGLLCTIAQQRLVFPPSTPGPLTPHQVSPAQPGAGRGSPMQFSYAYLKSARNHLSTRAGLCLCAVVALAHCDKELDEQLQNGAGSEIVHQLWRLKEWEDARESGGASELGDFDGKRSLMVGLANCFLRFKPLSY